MNVIQKRASALIMALAMMFALSAQASAADNPLDTAISRGAAYLLRTVSQPKVGSLGGEWAVIGLARSESKVPQTYWDDYYAAVEAELRANQGVLHEKKYTEYSRVVIALTAIGADPGKVAGYNLLTPLGDFEKTVWQGINGPVWALIALDCGDYAMPVNAQAKKQATRQMYVEDILSRQLSDGGWSLNGVGGGEGPADPDVTAMALQALSRYQTQPRVKTATEQALTCLSKRQESDGGYSSWGSSNSESVVQVMVALCELGISPDDARFVKNGKSLLDHLLHFAQTDGSFLHMSSAAGSNQMASEQGFYALVAVSRFKEGKPSLYRMSDVTIQPAGAVGEKEGLSRKNPDVKKMPILQTNLSFPDASSHQSRGAIEALAQRGIISGTPEGLFLPEKSMTRAEFATIVVKSLGLNPKADQTFQDVSPEQWYAPYVGTAYRYGIVNGVGEQRFAPSGTISRQEAALMVQRAAKLCGMNTEMGSAEIRDTLAPFGDYVTVSGWAQAGIAFCYRENMFDQNDERIAPLRPVLRGEIAKMLYQMLSSSALL